MARARNAKTTKSEENNAAEIKAIEALLNGETDEVLEIEDADFAVPAATEAAEASEVIVKVEATASEISDSDLDDIAAALGAPDAPEAGADVSDVDMTEIAAALDADVSKEEAYSDQVSAGDSTEPPEVEEPIEQESVKKEPVTRGARGNGLSSKSRDMEVFLNTVVQMLGDDAQLDTEEGVLTEEQVRQKFSGVAQIKVREKVLNLLQHVLSGGPLSTYTKIAAGITVQAQLDGCKPVTLAEIKTAMENANYKAGTVNAQSGQMMALFPVLGIAKRGAARGILEPNPNSVILDALASS